MQKAKKNCSLPLQHYKLLATALGVWFSANIGLSLWLCLVLHLPLTLPLTLPLMQ